MRYCLLLSGLILTFCHRRDGGRVQEWIGVVVPEADLRTALNALLKETR
jgi:hypothetical protein